MEGQRADVIDPVTEGNNDGFSEPDCFASFDRRAELASIPVDATVAGMFIAPLLAAVGERGRRLPSARERYLNFKFYPMREHAQLLLEAIELLFPDVTPRKGLRKLGRAAPQALLGSTLGRVTLGSAGDVEGALRAMVDTYPVNLPRCEASMEVLAPGLVHVSLRHVFLFGACHHVGVFEGTLRHAGVTGVVRARTLDPGSLDIECHWAAT